VTTNVEENEERNPNSIMYLLSKLLEESNKRGIKSGTLRIVSPYLFIAKYYDYVSAPLSDELTSLVHTISPCSITDDSLRIQIWF
jgi:hypothetical protein